MNRMPQSLTALFWGWGWGCPYHLGFDSLVSMYASLRRTSGFDCSVMSDMAISKLLKMPLVL